MKRLIQIFLAALVLTQSILPARAADAEYPGKAWVLMEASTGTVLQSSREHDPLPPASVTKIMTLLLIMEAVDGGRLSWQDPVTASETAAAKGGSQVYLKAGETMTVEDMVKSIAVSSANDCACAMAEHLAGTEAAFVEQMNEKAKALSMNDTHFVNCTGLDDGPEADAHRTSAHDIALMSRELLVHHPDIKKFTTIWMDSLRNGTFGLSNTNKLVRFYPGATGLKTGFTRQAGFCLSASALREGMELIAVVLGCDTSAHRFTACRQMLDYGFAAWAVYTPELSPELGVPVRSGRKNRVAVCPAEDCRTLTQRGDLPCITLRLDLPEEVPAPVAEGDRLGTLVILARDRILREIPLNAAESVPRRQFSDYFMQLLEMVSMGSRSA